MADASQGSSCPPCNTDQAIKDAPKTFYIGSVGFGALVGLVVGAVVVGIREEGRNRRGRSGR